MRAKRMLIRSGIIACGVILFGMLFRGSHLLVARRSPVTGAREQNGWTFLRRYNGEQRAAVNINAFVAFINRVFGQTDEQPPNAPYPALLLIAPDDVGRCDEARCLAGVEAQAISSTGDRFPLAFEPAEYRKIDQALYVRLPDVPDTYQWLDVVLTDKKKQAIWRVFDLPRLMHQTLGPIQTGPISPFPDVTLTARAYWNSKDALFAPDNGYDQLVLPVNAEIRVQKKQIGDVRHFWSLSGSDSELYQEWDGPYVQEQLWQLTKGRYSKPLFGDDFLPKSANIIPGATQVFRIAGFAAPHPRQQHIVQINSRLEEHQIFNETATFHDLHVSRMGPGWSLDIGANAVARTPSGITVRIVPTAARVPGAGPISDYDIKKDRIYCCFDIDQQGDNPALPASPLYRRYHRPIKVYGFLASTSDFSVCEYDSGGTAGGFEGDFGLKKVPVNHILPTLKFTVTQDTTLRTIPVRFVVPVTEGKPKMAWDGSDVPVAPGSDCGCAAE